MKCERYGEVGMSGGVITECYLSGCGGGVRGGSAAGSGGFSRVTGDGGNGGGWCSAAGYRRGLGGVRLGGERAEGGLVNKRVGV